VADLTGELIDNRYLLQRILASGGMATIYAGLDTRLYRPVAVKIMHPHLANDEAFVGRFIKEAKATAALSHPNIVSIQDQGWNEGGVPAVFIVMELVEGSTLRDFLNEQGVLSIDQLFQFLNPVVSALSAAHRIGIIHRDIKPENILIAKDGRVKVADFGLAAGSIIGQTMTAESSVVLGSVSYLSPEQVQRGIADARSDIYALGIVMFEMLAGKKPYEGETPIQIAYKHVNERIPNLKSINEAIPEQIAEIIFAATSPNPDQRPKDAEELLNQLRSIQAQIDPKRRQLSLELDLPPAAISVAKRKNIRGKVRVASAFEGLKEKTSQIITPKTDATKVVKEDSVATKRRKTSKRVKRNRAIALLILAAVIYGVYSLLGAGRITVPSLAGMTQKEATAALTELALKTEIGEEVFSEDVPVGKVISSTPGGGGKVNKDGVVKLNISKGKERIIIPSLVGTTPDVAIQKLAEIGLKIGETSEIFSAAAEKGFVVATEPKLSTEVKRNSIVNIFVSKGVEQVSLISFSGKGGEEAINELTNAGFDVAPAYKFSDTVLPGLVISQDPESSAAINKGSKVILNISKGPEFVYIPNVISKSSNQATLDLENKGLKVVVKGKGTKVVSISPKQGSKVKAGSTVTISLG
jgi:serine/threonine protein kinase/beta-lactam-binding protein with PASTA domain